MTDTIEQFNVTALRQRIHELRDEIVTLSAAIRSANAARQSPDSAHLLRRRSELTRELFQTQTELLALFRAIELPAADSWAGNRSARSDFAEKSAV